MGAAIRELEEETGLVGYEIAYLFQFGGLNQRHHVFQALIPENAAPAPRNEIARCRWHKAERVPKVAASVPARQIVDLALRHKNVTIDLSPDHLAVDS